MLQQPCIGNYTISIPTTVGFINVKLYDGKYEMIVLSDKPWYSIHNNKRCETIEKLKLYLAGMPVVWYRDEIASGVFTNFQERMFQIMSEHVTFGKLITYGELAVLLESSPRGVAASLKHNPLPIILPCHRVVGKTGLGGFSAGLKWKKFLLRVEGVDI